MNATITDTEALDAIQDLLSGRVWDVEDLEIIAGILEQTGRSIDEPTEDW